MLPKILLPQAIVDPDLEKRRLAAELILKEFEIKNPSPDLLWLEGQKLGIEQAKTVRQFLTLKPFQHQYKAVVILDAENLTPDAQNALLKSIEEPIGETVMILGISQEEDLLETIQSRVQMVKLEKHQENSPDQSKNNKQLDKLNKLDQMSYEERFQLIEKTTDRPQLLLDLVQLWQQRLNQKEYQSAKYLEFMDQLLLAEKWSKSNVNPRAILEYLLLAYP